jgi:hypothetical protein
VYFYGGGATFTMSGGTISGNTALYGGGVYVYNYAIFTKTDGAVYGDTLMNTTTPQTSGPNANTATETTPIAVGKSGHAVILQCSNPTAYYYCNEDLENNANGNISTTDTLPTASGQTVGNWTKFW